jgi:hypothetical protein
VTEIAITNPDFETGFYQYNNVTELQVGRGWAPWWIQGSPDEIGQGYMKRPEFKAEQMRVLTGHLAQKWFTTYATHDAGLCQIVTGLTPGAKLTLSAEVQYWSEHDDGTGGGLACRVGIDPTGATEPLANTVIWGAWHGQDDPDKWKGDTWRTVTVQAEAQGPAATLFLRSACRYRAKHNDAYFDHVTLTADVEQPGGDDVIATLVAELQRLTAHVAHLDETIQLVFHIT